MTVLMICSKNLHPQYVFRLELNCMTKCSNFQVMHQVYTLCRESLVCVQVSHLTSVVTFRGKFIVFREGISLFQVSGRHTDVLCCVKMKLLSG